MSIRVYRLLRNNNQEGPFTSEELIQKNLRPYDLIWIDGRSVAWSYPGELPEFKLHTPLPGEDAVQNYNNKQTSTKISPSVQAAVVVNDSIAQPVLKQKPRYKVSAAWSKIQTVTTPVYKNIIIDETQKNSSQKKSEVIPAAAPHSKSLSWHEAWLDWEKEKNVTIPPEQINTKSASVQSQKTTSKNFEPVLETKYIESLDSLKDKYIENILEQKKRSGKRFSFGKASEFIVPSIALIIIFSIGYWLLHKTNTTAAPSIPVTAKSVQPAAVINRDSLANNNKSIVVSETPATATKEKQNIIPKTKPAVISASKVYSRQITKPSITKQAGQSKQNKPVATNVDSATSDQTKKTTDKSLQRPVEINVYQEPAATNADNLNNVTEEQSNNTEKPPIVNKVKSTTDYVSVPEHLYLNKGSATLKIQNISDINLDLVVVNVQYFDPSNHFRKGETMYLHNLRAGKNVTIKTPKDINSLYATSKVSLVSADAENVYVVGEQ